MIRAAIAASLALALVSCAAGPEPKPSAAPAHPEANSYAVTPDAMGDVDAALARAAANGKHMVYLSGMKAHAIDDEAMLDHIVRLVEEKAAAIEAGEATAFDPHAAPAQATEAAE